MEILTIGQVAKKAMVNVQTVRYYEHRGLIPVPPRLKSGYRHYTGDIVNRIHFIKNAQALGFSLNEISELLSLRVDPKMTCREVKKHADAKIIDIEEKMNSLKKMRKALVKLSASCHGSGPTSQCPILDTLENIKAGL